MPRELLRARRIVEFYASDAETLQRQIDNSLQDGFRAIWDTPEKYLGIRVETVGPVERVIVDASEGSVGASPDPHPVHPPGEGYSRFPPKGAYFGVYPTAVVAFPEPGCGCVDMGDKGILPCDAHRIEALTFDQERADRLALTGHGGKLP